MILRLVFDDEIIQFINNMFEKFRFQEISRMTQFQNDPEAIKWAKDIIKKTDK